MKNHEIAISVALGILLGLLSTTNPSQWFANTTVNPGNATIQSVRDLANQPVSREQNEAAFKEIFG